MQKDGDDTEEKILTSSNSQNQSFFPQWNQRSRHDQNLQAGTFSEAKDLLDDLMLKPPLPHSTKNDQVPKPSNWNQPCQYFCKTAYPPQTHQSSVEPQTRETDMSSASSLFAGQHCNKTLCYLKSYDQNISFYALGAASPLLGNITLKITLWRSKINNITKQLCLNHGKSEK